MASGSLQRTPATHPQALLRHPSHKSLASPLLADWQSASPQPVACPPASAKPPAPAPPPRPHPPPARQTPPTSEPSQSPPTLLPSSPLPRETPPNALNGTILTRFFFLSFAFVVAGLFN